MNRNKKLALYCAVVLSFGVVTTHAVAPDSSANSGFEIKGPVNSKEKQTQKPVDTDNLSSSKQKEAPVTTQSAPVSQGNNLITETSDTAAKTPSDSVQNALPPVEKLPEFKGYQKAQYPVRELKEGIEGEVILELIISDSGRVTSVSVIKGITPALDSAAKNAADKFLFAPAIAGGKPVPVMLQYSYRFSVAEELNQVLEYVNLKGVLKEKRSGVPISDGLIVASFQDSSNSDTSLTVPWGAFLRRIGSFSGQHVEQGKLVTTSDSLGRFAFKALPAGNVKLSFIMAGYLADTGLEKIEKGKLLAVEYHFKKQKHNEYEIVVYGKMEREKAVSQISITPAQISKLPSLGEADICRSLQLLPGISGSNESSAGLYVRGGTPDQNLILFDDFNVYHVDHFYGFFSAFSPQAVKDIMLYKGGFDARYGGRISSVMDITGKTGDTCDLNYGGGLSLLSANAFLEVPLFKKGSLLFVGRRSYTDFIKFGIYDKINNLFQGADQTPSSGPTGGPGRFNSMAVEPSFYFYDFNGKASYNITDKDVLSASLYNSKDKLDNSRESSMNMRPPGSSDESNVSMTTKDYSGWGSWGASTKWARQWADRFYTHTVLAYSNYFDKRERSSQTKIEETMQNASALNEDNDVKDITLKQDNGWRLNRYNKIEFGGQVSLINIAYKNTQDDSNTIMNRRDSALQAAAYLQDNLNLFDERLSLTPGLRVTYFEKTHSYYPEPRFSVGYQILKPFKLKAATGTYHQFINRVTRENVLSGSNDFWLLADDKIIPVSSANHYIAGFSYETPMLLFDVEAYRKNMEGLSEFTMRYSGPRGSNMSIDSMFYQGTGVAKGLEVLLQKKTGMYTGWIGYTLGQVMHTFPELNNGNPFPALHDQTHEFKIVNMLSLGKWDLSGTWVYATGKPYSAPVGEYDVHLLDGSTYRYIHVGDMNSFRLPAYHRLDLSAKYHFTISTAEKENKYKGDIGISLFNAYNRTNVWYKEFEFVQNQIVETNVNYIGFMPSIFVNIRLK